MFGFGFIKTNRFDRVGECRFAQCQHGRRIRRLGKEGSGREIDRPVCRLSRQDDGRQQLKWGIELKLGRGRRVGRLQAGKNLPAIGRWRAFRL